MSYDPRGTGMFPKPTWWNGDPWDEFPPVVECLNCSGEGGWDVFNFGGPEEWFVCDVCNGQGVLDEEDDQ